MEFVSIIITPIVESLLIPVKKHLGFLVSSTTYARDMKDKMDQLNLTEQDIQNKKKTADANNHEVSHHVLPWLEDVQKMNEKAQSIPPGGVGCFNLAKRYKTGKQSYTILNHIRSLKERESEIKWTNEQRSLAEVASTSAPVPHGAENNFDSRDLIFNDALQSLQSNNENHNMIALCGMGGVGKTAMMEQLKKAVKDANMFDLVVKVVIGENTDPIYIQRAIAQYIGKDLTETDKDARADRLRERFLGMSQDGKKKVLVIMDDVWKEVDLKDVGLSPLPNGFKLLFTSRYEDVCTRMGVKTSSIFKVHVLNDEEAKALFFETAGPSLLDGDDADFQMIGEAIVKKCGGLPMAIITIAKILSGNIKEAWEKALWRLEQDNLKDLESIMYRIIEMSYNNLKEDDDKSIFLLIGLFPDDFDIHIEDLLRYAWGLSSFKDVKTLAMARSHMKICVNNLILHANLLIESEQMGCVKMQHLVRAFVLSNFTKVKQASLVNYGNMSLQRLTPNSNKSYERILLRCTGMSKFPRDFNYPNLLLLILMDGNKLLKFPEDFYKRMNKLEVVSYDNMGIPLLPVTFEHSIKLRTLCLRSCSLINDEISFLGSLSNLEILSLIDCNVRRLPSAIGKLKKLKLLDLTGCVDLCIDDGVFQNLLSLEELYMRAFKGRYLRLTHANCDELEKLSQGLFAFELEFFENKPQLKNVSFKNLERFRISIGCGLEYDEKYIFKNSMKFVANCNELQECQISELFEKVEELELQVNGMNHLEDISMHHKFFTLRDLHVSKCADLTYLFTADMVSCLKKLERLTISDCPILKTLVGENTGDMVITFKKLKFMSLKNLPKMVSLCNNVIELPEMMELVLHGLPKFLSIYPENNDKSSMQSLLHKEVMIPKLEKLDICMMENLKQIWPCQIFITEKYNASMLRQITVTDCDSLTNLFPCNPLPLVNNLEDLTIKKCGSIEVLFIIDLESVCRVGEYSSRLRSIEVEHSWKLKELWRMRGVNNSNIIINEFKGVEIIRIKGCKRFTNVFSPTTTKFNLSALATYISHNNAQDFEEKKRKTTEIDEKLKGEIIEMDPIMTYPSYLLHTCHHLQNLQLKSDKRVGEVVFEMDSPPPLLPNLEILKLSYLKDMSHVWKCNWNKFLVHQPLEFPFQNLTKISLWDCHKLKYLFSPLMTKYLSNLKQVKINDCKGIEEVISSRDDEILENATCSSSRENTTIFPHLDILNLRKLCGLKCIDGGDNKRSWSNKISSDISTTIHDQFKSGQAIGACWSLCQYPRKMIIYSCDALTSLVPWYAVENMKRLENLEIENCKMLMEVFESEAINNYTNNVDEGSASCVDGMSATLTSPTLKNITSVVPQLSNLKSVFITECKLLPHIFTFSTLESLNQLKELKVKRCETVQVIVKGENGTPSKVVVFPSLKTLELHDLPNLMGFFLGMNDFVWPVLVNVVIKDCPRLMAFTCGQSKTPRLKNVRTSLGKHSLESGLNFQTTFPTSPTSDSTFSKAIPWSFHNLIEVIIEKTSVERFIPSTALLQLQKLEKIRLSSCDGAKEVFEVALEDTNSSGVHESQTVVEILNLKKVDLVNVASIKYLWKINRLIILEFPNLTTVSFHKCNSLEHVFTCAMVSSLLHLKDIHISECMNIVVIVKEEEEKKHDAKVKKIVLRRLKSFELKHLQSLKGFCLGNAAFSLPSLDTLQINDCPAITGFTKGYLATPKLKVINTSFGMCYVHGDLNSFIKTKQEEGHEF